MTASENDKKKSKLTCISKFLAKSEIFMSLIESIVSSIAYAAQKFLQLYGD